MKPEKQAQCYLPVPFYLESGRLKKGRNASPLSRKDFDFLYGSLNTELREHIMIGYHLPLAFNNKFYRRDNEHLSDLMYGLFKAVRNYGGQKSFAAFAYVCMRNEIIDSIRRKRILQMDTDFDRASTFNLEQIIEDRELSEILSKLLRKLPEKKRKPVELYLQGYTSREIREKLGLSKLLEWQRRTRGVEFLKSYFLREGPTLSRR